MELNLLVSRATHHSCFNCNFCRTGIVNDGNANCSFIRKEILHYGALNQQWPSDSTHGTDKHGLVFCLQYVVVLYVRVEILS